MFTTKETDIIKQKFARMYYLIKVQSKYMTKCIGVRHCVITTLRRWRKGEVNIEQMKSCVCASTSKLYRKAPPGEVLVEGS